MIEQTNELKKLLLEIEFSEKEAEVYLAILVLGRGTASRIAREAHVFRTTVYDILGSLFNKGLVTLSGKEPKQEYAAESPDVLAALFSEKAKEMNINAQRAASLALELKSVQKVGDRPQVKFYEGIDGLRQVYDDTLTSTGPILAYASVDDVAATLGDYYPQYYERRAKKGIFAKGIITKTPMAIERAKHNKEEGRETIFVAPDKFNFHPEINIYNNKVMIASWREKLGIIIESEEIADAMRKVFELSWVGAEKLSTDAK